MAGTAGCSRGWRADSIFFGEAQNHTSMSIENIDIITAGTNCFSRYSCLCWCQLVSGSRAAEESSDWSPNKATINLSTAEEQVLKAFTEAKVE